MPVIDKILAFEYVLNRLLGWQKEFKNSDINDLSILKALKLLFFVSASKAKEDEDCLLIDGVFNSFVAMPYGHVESDVYNTIRDKEGELTYYRIDNKHTATKEGQDVNKLHALLDKGVTVEIDESINFLKSVNPKLILLSAFELVDLSHAWYSWKLTYSQAQKSGLKSSSIDSDLIKKEDKIFSLQTF